MAKGKKGQRQPKNRRRGPAPKQPTLNTNALWVLVVGCIIGGALAMYATNLTFEIERNGIENPSSCSINSWINCDAAHASSYANLLGVPVAWWGFLFYLVAGLAGLYAATGSNKSRGAAGVSVALILSIGAILFSFVKAYHLFDLGILCLVCVGMYIMNIVVFVGAMMGLGLSFGKLGSFLSNYFGALFGQNNTLDFDPEPLRVGLVVLGVFGIGFVIMQRHAGQTLAQNFDMDRALALHFRQASIDVPIHPDAAYWGNPDAAIKIVEFSDFQCPACKQAASHMRAVIREFEEEVGFYYMHYPLDTAINDSLIQQVHPQAGMAAIASECARQEGDFWDYHDEIFVNQRRLSQPLLLDMAEDRGWDRSSFEACMTNPATESIVREHVRLANEVRVARTPTLYVNGRNVQLWNNTAFIRETIREELSRQ